MPDITIDLESPITGHDGEIRKLTLREPKWRDVMANGQPFTMHRPPGGDPIIVEDDEKLLNYAEALLTEPKEPTLLNQLGVSDTFRVRNTIIGFFLKPAAASAG